MPVGYLLSVKIKREGKQNVMGIRIIWGYFQLDITSFPRQDLVLKSISKDKNVGYQ